MHTALSWQQALEEARIPDARLADAYEALGGRGRALLKTCLARLHAFWGERPAEETLLRRFAQGFSVRSHHEAAAFALFACHPTRTCAAHLLAAAVPALLAHVPCIAVCFVPEPDRPPVPLGPHGPAEGEGPADLFTVSPVCPECGVGSDLLAALELAGLEQSALLSAERCAALMEALVRDLGPGRLVLLGEPAGWETLALLALGCGIPLQAPGRVDLERRPDAGGVAGPERSARAGSGSQADPVRESVRIWSWLGPDWFQERRAVVLPA